MTNIAEIIDSAREAHGQVWLTNYQDSAGKVANYRLQVHPGSFYPELLQQARAMLQSIIESDAQREGLPAPVYMRTAANKLLTNLDQRQLNFEEQQKTAAVLPPAHPNIQPIENGVMLRNVETIEEVVVTPTPTKTSKRASVPQERTQEQQAEKWIRDNWPLVRFGASFKLLPGKFSTIVPVP